MNTDKDNIRLDRVKTRLAKGREVLDNSEPEPKPESYAVWSKRVRAIAFRKT